MPRPVEHRRVPAVAFDQQLPEAADLEVADRLRPHREVRPVGRQVGRGDEGGDDPDRRRVAPGPRRGATHRRHRGGHRVDGEERVQDDPVEHPPGEVEPAWPDGAEDDRRRAVRGQVGEAHPAERPRRPLLSDRLARPQPPQHAHQVLQAAQRRRRDAERGRQRAQSPAEPEDEPAAAHRVRSRRQRGDGEGMAGALMDHGGPDATPLGRRGECPADHPGLLEVEPLADVDRAEAGPLGVARLPQGAGGVARPGNT